MVKIIKSEAVDPRVLEAEATSAETVEVWRFRNDGTLIGTEIRLKEALPIG